MDIFLFRALANSIKVKNASSSSKNADIKGVLKSTTLATVGSSGGSGRGQFQSVDPSLDEVYNAYKTDSYIRQAVDKYSELLFKAGWKLQGNNDNAVQYLQSRFAFMSFATGQSWDQLLIEVAEDLVKYGNAILIKARNKKNLPMGSVKATGIGKQGTPVGGYFRANPRTMQVQTDQYGNVTAWQQQVNGGTKVSFKVEDVIHIYYKREAGEIFALPYYAPALEDVRLLRQLEDNVALLVYRYAVPIYHWIIGIAQAGYEASTDEIIEARNKINEMPSDGAIITNERTSIKVIGADGQALQAEPYLRYYEQRVFTGLGVSETQMGRGGTANKNTADSLDQSMVDRVKAFQKVMGLGITNGVITELLMEGGFDPLNNPDDQVNFVFNEINVDTQIKVENHQAFLFQNNAITLDELRTNLGYKAADESRLAFNLMGMTQPTPGATNLDKPANQHGQKQAPTIKPKTESVQIGESYQGFQPQESQPEDIYYMFMKDIDNADSAHAQLMATSATNMISKRILSNTSYIEKAKNDVKIEKSLQSDITIDENKVLSIIESELKRDIFKMLTDVASKSTTNDKAAVFKTNEYRLKFIRDYWTGKMYNISKILCYKTVGCTHVEILGADESDDKCSPKNTVLAISNYTTKNIPPFHPGCECQIKPKE